MSIRQNLKQKIFGETWTSLLKISLCFINWMKSGILLVEDLFSEGAFKDITEFPNLRCKNNWLYEYKILKNVFMKIKPNERCIVKREYVSL